MADNSQTLNWSAQTAAASAQSSAAWAPTCVINNQSGQIVYARTDGVTAVAQAAGTVEIASGATVVLANGQPLPNNNVAPNKDQSESKGWTAQQGYTNATLYPTAPNFVSLIPAASASGTINVSFQ